MNYQRFSKRQLLALTWWNRPRFRNRDAIICDGSVRSGKTLCMAVGFILWSLSAFEGLAQVTESRSENKVTVTIDGRTNTYYLFGGRDESSYALIQGMTLAGVLLDEVALMPKSFVEQALARCSVAGSKFWFNCNPEGPEHWFKKEWVDKEAEHNALHLHFTMTDNPSLSPEIKTRYESMYSGVFYQRYILGEWRVAEGLVYEFDKAKHTTDKIPEYGQYFISCDYGTLNPFSVGLWCFDGEKAVRIREYYYSGREGRALKTDEEYYAELERLADGLPIEHVIVDPSAASFIETIRRHGHFSVRKARNEVLPGIRLTSTLLKAGRILIHTSCTDAIREFELYCWDDKGQVDKPLKVNDHAMDDIRYFCSTVMRRKVRGFDMGGDGDG